MRCSTRGCRRRYLLLLVFFLEVAVFGNAAFLEAVFFFGDVLGAAFFLAVFFVAAFFFGDCVAVVFFVATFFFSDFLGAAVFLAGAAFFGVDVFFLTTMSHSITS